MATKMTREEAINKVRQMNLPKETMEILQALAPELAESEDERIRRTLVEYFGPSAQLDFIRGVPIKKIRDWLEKQKEQKPAGWSEEDEKKIIFLERLIEHNVPDGQYGWVDGRKGGFVTKSEAISMLKSLRPSWKPSEEQMYALKVTLDYMPDTFKPRCTLMTLQDDLKKTDVKQL